MKVALCSIGRASVSNSLFDQGVFAGCKRSELMNRRTRLRHDEDGRQSDSLRLAHSFTTAKSVSMDAECTNILGEMG